jgi:D-psicose/D-tagatose/L-ribulose 3-epimerase
MKFGVNSYIWAAAFDASQLPILPRIKAWGFDGIEVPVFRPAEFDAVMVRRGLEANGLEVTTCASLVPGLSLITDDADVRKRTLAHVKDAIKVSAEVGSRLFAGPLYCPVGEIPGRRRTADEWKRAIEGIQALGDTLVSHNVTLAIEPLNRFETYFLNTDADAKALADAVNHPNVGILFDTFHANIEEKDIAEGCRTLGRHVRHVHTCENDRGTPGSGHVDWSGVAHALKDIGYDGWLTIESFGFALGDLSAAAAIWRDIESSPEDIASKGLPFLKKLMA